MKTTRKLLLALVLVMSILMTLAVAVIPASAVTLTGGEKLYLVPSSNWNESTPRFAAYFCNGTSAATWVNMKSIGNNVYEVTVPSGNHKNVIFCRMNGSASANNWDNRWNQTADLVFDGTKNLYTVSGWDSGSWSKATCSQIGHAFKDGKCSACSFSQTIYLKPNGNWKADGARFAMYLFNSDSDNTWVGMEAVGTTGLYKATLPNKYYKSVIFCRMNGSASANNWNNKWDQTKNLDLVANNELFTINDGDWNNADGKWSNHTCTGGTATCSAKAVCTVCNNPYGEKNANNHTGTAQALTSGGTANKHAVYSCCPTVTANADHSYNQASDVQFSAATCTAPQYRKGKCSCGAISDADADKKLGTTEALGHDYTITYTWSDDNKTCTASGVCNNDSKHTLAEETANAVMSNSTATCGKAGTATFTATFDNEKYAQQVKNNVSVPATGNHTETTLAGKDATCTATGLTEGKKCTTCGVTTVAQTEIAAKGHTETTLAGKAATCTETGLTEGKKCSVCGTVTLAQDKIPALGHTNGTPVVETVDATCTDKGSVTTTVSCATCGVQLDQTVAIIPAKGHTPGAEATCTTAQVCTVCNAELVKALGHSVGCGHAAVDAEGNGYDTIEDALSVKGAEVKLLGDVTITGDLKIFGATLDLNGKTLEAGAVVTFNASIIDNVGTGKIIVNVDSETNKPMLEIAEGNYKYAPIHVETKDGKSTYVITPVKVQGVTAELSNTAVVRPSLLGAQYTNKQLFADNVIAHGITFELLVTRDNGVDKPEQATLDFTEEQIKTLYSDNKHAIKLTLVGGLEGYTYTVELVVKSANTMVHSTVVAIHYVPVTTPKVETEPETTND